MISVITPISYLGGLWLISEILNELVSLYLNMLPARNHRMHIAGVHIVHVLNRLTDGKLDEPSNVIVLVMISNIEVHIVVFSVR